MSFAQPLLLWLALLAPLDLVLVARRLPRLAASLEVMAGPRRGADARARLVAASLFGAAASALFVVAAALALAGPSWGSRAVSTERSGLEVAIVLDVSRSMMVRERALTRLASAREEVRSFLRVLPGASFSLVAAKGSAILLVPMTDDLEAIDVGLDYADPDTLSAIGTDLGAALRAGLGSFSSAGGANKVILLLSDGGDQGKDGLAAAGEARKEGVRVLAFGLGSATPLPVPGPEGSPLLDAQGRAVRSALEPKLLLAIAQASGGRYLEASDPGARAVLQAELAGLGRGGRRTEYQVEDRSGLFALIALACLLGRFAASLAAYREGRHVA